MKKLHCLAVIFLLAPGANAHSAATDSSVANVVDVVATEYRFEMPDTLPAGPTLFRLTDKGSQLHHMTIIKLGQGKTVADLAALPPGPFPAWAEFEGGPNSPRPMGGKDGDVVDLTPGQYAVICLIPGPDGKPHMMKGMERALTVTPASEKRGMPASDVNLELVDYAFAFSRPLTSGHHAVRVTNHGSQLHEAEMFRLAPGKTGKDILQWVATGMQGPPPGMPVAGTSPMTPGKSNILMMNLSNGDYALLCFMPDARDGKLHAAHGMIHDFHIQ